MGAVQNALIKSQARLSSARDYALIVKAKGGTSLDRLLTPSDGYNSLTQFQQSGANRQRYQLFRGWVHAAINALASKAAGQPVQVGKMSKDRGGKAKPKSTKSHVLNKLPKSLGAKAATNELEVINDHPLLVSLERPNTIQHRWQFVYSYVANLCLTGWSFVVCGENKAGEMEYFSIPTTWVIPDHTQGPFSRFRLVNPNNPTAVTYTDDDWFDRSQIGFSYFPDPSDPMRALSLTQAQQMGIRIDDHIQTSQSTFFENGVFPSVIVTVGAQPHPDFPAGVRPRLNATQRRQVYAAIKKVSGGVANYGNPAIVDGLIEKIDRLSATQNEMGWEKSEQAVRTRILSAFSVHPFILGEAMAGSYAQAYIVQQIFCDRVNIYLEMLGWLMTNLQRENGDKDLLVWWTPAKPVDPQMEQQLWATARTRGDVTENEFRAQMLDLPPIEESNESFIDKSSLQQVLLVASNATGGMVTTEQAQAILEALGLPTKLAVRIAGDGPTEPPPDPMAPEDGSEEYPDETTDDQGQPNDGNADAGGDESAVEKAAKSLAKVVGYLESTPAEIADLVLAEI